MLPQHGQGRSIRREAGDGGEGFDLRAAPVTRAAALVALGWPLGVIPSSKALGAHALSRLEREFAEHLYLDHGSNVGRWCDECSCVCARAEDAMEQRDWNMALARDRGSTMDAAEIDTADDLAGIDVIDASSEFGLDYTTTGALVDGEGA